ncbi:hypothetical protein [Psychromicrobium xiongbiense]|uniref:hypothetical protein n=1 Tax=Psychromicrobium xiongbiense TaxID=3051184 RepID=UPI00255480E4|nr:hypothetical protein [Psychromicrobium sp. YIM S02556]
MKIAAWLGGLLGALLVFLSAMVLPYGPINGAAGVVDGGSFLGWRYTSFDEGSAWPLSLAFAQSWYVLVILVLGLGPFVGLGTRRAERFAGAILQGLGAIGVAILAITLLVVLVNLGGDSLWVCGAVLVLALLLLGAAVLSGFGRAFWGSPVVVCAALLGLVGSTSMAWEQGSTPGAAHGVATWLMPVGFAVSLIGAFCAWQAARRREPVRRSEPARSAR